MLFLVTYINSSPELNDLKRDKPVVISSEFPSWQDDKGESKGGMFLFKLGAKKGKKNPPKEIKVSAAITSML